MKFPVSWHRIDWPNHIIAFFSALFGILIAFELDEWRGRKHELEFAQIAFDNLKKEIQINQNGLHSNIAENIKQITALQSLLSKLDNQLRFTGSSVEADSINLNYGHLVFIEQIDSFVKNKTYRPIAHIGMGNIAIPALQTSAWESAKATGALNLMEYERVQSLSYLYNPPRILDELNEIRFLWQNSDKVSNKTDLIILLREMEKAHKAIDSNLQGYDQFVNILNAME